MDNNKPRLNTEPFAGALYFRDIKTVEKVFNDDLIREDTLVQSLVDGQFYKYCSSWCNPPDEHCSRYGYSNSFYLPVPHPEEYLSEEEMAEYSEPGWDYKGSAEVYEKKEYIEQYYRYPDPIPEGLKPKFGDSIVLADGRRIPWDKVKKIGIMTEPKKFGFYYCNFFPNGDDFKSYPGLPVLDIKGLSGVLTITRILHDREALFLKALFGRDSGEDTAADDHTAVRASFSVKYTDENGSEQNANCCLMLKHTTLEKIIFNMSFQEKRKDLQPVDPEVFDYIRYEGFALPDSEK